MSLRDKLKGQLDRETVATILSFIGISITRNYKFSDNPSMCIAPNSLIKEFGNSDFETGDIFDYIMYAKGVGFPEALSFVDKCLNGGNYGKVA